MNIQDFFLQTNSAGLGPFQILYDEDGDGRLIYVGFAPKNVTTAQALWWIVKITYFSSGNPSSEKTAPVNSIWDNRASLTYA